MAQVNTIDSNITGLAYALEGSLGFLPGENGNPGVPTWYRLNPNSYNDFGSEVVLEVSNPINPDRQRDKGVPVDLNVNGGFNHNLNFFNLQHLLQGVLLANMREKGFELVTAVDIDAGNPDEYEVAATAGFLVGSLIKGFGFTNAENNAMNAVTAVVSNTSVEVANGLLVAEPTPPAGAYIKVVGHVAAVGDIDVNAAGALPIVTSTTLDFTTLGLVPGQAIFFGDGVAGNSFTNAANNGIKRIRSVAANALTLDKSVGAMVTEANTTSTIRMFFGDVLKNELGTSIVRKSYQIERSLGAPDSASPGQIQTELLRGALPNEFTLNVPTAKIINADVTFIGIDNQQRTGVTGPKQTSVQNFLDADVFNSTSDVSRIKMSLAGSTDEAPTPLFAFLTDMTITVNNNMSPLKAVGVFGGFDVTVGTFQVGGKVTAYFGNVDAVSAVRNSSDVTLDVFLAKNNQGINVDIPLIALGDGRLNVEQDKPITLPLNIEAARGRKINSGLDYTIMFTFFSYLPSTAE